MRSALTFFKEEIPRIVELRPGFLRELPYRSRHVPDLRLPRFPLIPPGWLTGTWAVNGKRVNGVSLS